MNMLNLLFNSLHAHTMRPLPLLVSPRIHANLPLTLIPQPPLLLLHLLVPMLAPWTSVLAAAASRLKNVLSGCEKAAACTVVAQVIWPLHALLLNAPSVLPKPA